MDESAVGSTIATYDRIAPLFAARWFNLDIDTQHRRFADAIAGQAPPSRFRILDAGCGPGRDSKWFHARGFQVVGVDLSAGMLAEARRRVPNVEFRQADLRHLDFPDDSFDGIWCCASLLHVSRADVPGVLRDFRRILGHGWLYLVVKNGEGELIDDARYGAENPRRFTLFSRPEVELFVERAGFWVVEVDEEPSNHDPVHPWIRVLARTTLETPLVGAGAIVFDDAGRILMSERADGRGWNLPGGFLDPTESPEEAVVREVREETGLEVEAGQLIAIHSIPYRYRDAPRLMVLHGFLCRPIGGTLRPTNEGLQHGWFAPDALPAPMSSRHQYDLVRHACAWRDGRTSTVAVRRY